MSRQAKSKSPANGKSSPDPKSIAAPQDLGLNSFRNVPEDEGLSLDKLKGAFAAMLGAGDDPYSVPADPEQDPLQPAIVVEEEADSGSRSTVDGACEVNPRSILEAMLFVGLPGNVPLTAQQVAGLMRGVRPAEIDELVSDLNADYARSGRPYTIVSQGPGYRITLREEFQPVRERSWAGARRRSSRKWQSKCWLSWPITDRSPPMKSLAARDRKRFGPGPAGPPAVAPLGPR